MLSKAEALAKATESLEKSRELYSSMYRKDYGEAAMAAAKAAEVWVQIANAVDSSGK